MSCLCRDCTILRVQTLRRRLFASVCVLSLILCLATVGLWVRSYSAYDAITRGVGGRRTFEAASLEGVLRLTHEKRSRRSRVYPEGWSRASHGGWTHLLIDRSIRV